MTGLLKHDNLMALAFSCKILGLYILLEKKLLSVCGLYFTFINSFYRFSVETLNVDTSSTGSTEFVNL